MIDEQRELRELKRLIDGELCKHCNGKITEIDYDNSGYANTCFRCSEGMFDARAEGDREWNE